MANQEQLEIVKQGVQAWNKWREKNPEAKVDLSGADLNRANLSGVNLVGVNFIGAKFNEADLSEAKLSKANLYGAYLFRAHLSGADLRVADLHGANLHSANLFEAKLAGADLFGANLTETSLSGADLTGANLHGATLPSANLNKANFSEADLSEASIGETIFANVDLSQTYGLESVDHMLPSTISSDTIQRAKGEIPDVFLRGCGLSDWEIESAKLYKPGLSNQEINNIIYKIFDLRANQAIQISPLFISYSHADAPFVERLEPNLTKKGIRFWRDVHNMTSGRIEKQIDHAMRQNPTVILILSENSTVSDWVEHEARLARDLEKEIGRDVLCPIALDDSWKSAKWPARLMEQIKEYNILNYSNWNDDKAFEQVFNKMISGLDMFYKPDAESPK
jgi:uncharacterized protein YjbI with pentapeptide repeats